MRDITVIDGGSVVQLRPNTPEAVDWIGENIGQDNGFQPDYPTVTCERRYVGDLLAGMQDAGLSMEIDGKQIKVESALL